MSPVQRNTVAAYREHRDKTNRIPECEQRVVGLKTAVSTVRIDGCGMSVSNLRVHGPHGARIIAGHPDI